MGQTETTKASFENKLNSKLAQTEKGNIFFSPYSIKTALGMAASGAKGDTRKSLCAILGCPEAAKDHDAYFKKLIEGVNGTGADRAYQLVTANALWGHVTFDYNEDFRTSIKENYGGAFHEVDYVEKPQEAVDAINAWVAKQTTVDGVALIPSIIGRIDVNKETRLVLTNAICFKGKWQVPFEKESTQDQDFFGKQKTTKVPLMHQVESQRYYETEGLQAVDLPYKGDDLSMLVVLPAKADGFATLEQRWDDNTYQQVCQGLWLEEDMKLWLPRFKIEASFKLKPALEELGAQLAFSDFADFTGISDERVKISEVIHKAFVECDEEGTKAAAATAVMMARCAAFLPSKEPKVFRADRPFLFFIRNKKTNEILFQGRATDL